jgi:hypothetical protein
MKPFESPEGTRGVLFEGPIELGALATSLACLVNTVDRPGNSVVQEATVMRDVARDMLVVESQILRDVEPREITGADARNDPTVAWAMTDPHQLEIAEVALQLGAFNNTELVRTLAAATYAEFSQTMIEQGLRSQ